MKPGDRVQWQEGVALQYTCTGTMIYNCSDNLGRPSDFFTIKVDDECYHRACHTADEMSLHWVNRSTRWNKLQLLKETS